MFLQLCFVPCLWLSVMLSVMESGELLRVELGASRGASHSKNVLNIPAFLDIRTVQEGSNHGISFAIEIVNSTGQPAELVDPTDNVNIRLIDSAGNPCALPAVPPVWMIKTADPSGTKSNLDKNRPYAYEPDSNASSSPTVKSPTDLAEGVVKLLPGERFRFRVRILEILDDPNYWQSLARRDREGDHSAPPVPEKKPIPPGDYRLFVTVRVADTKSGGRTVESGEIAVTLKSAE